MKELTWKEATDYVANYNELNKIVFVIFSDPTCGQCNQLKDDIAEFENDYFEVIVVYDGHELTFPMPQYPTCYSFIPKMEGHNPLIKVGGAPKEILESDIKVQLEAFKTKKNYYKVIEEWAQKPQTTNA